MDAEERGVVAITQALTIGYGAGVGCVLRLV